MDSTGSMGGGSNIYLVVSLEVYPNASLIKNSSLGCLSSFQNSPDEYIHVMTGDRAHKARETK